MAARCSIPTTAGCCAPRGLVVWLQAPPAVARRRASATASTAPAARAAATAPRTLERLGDLRAPAYEAAADVAVDTEDRTVDEVAAAVIEEFSAWNG